MACKLPSVSKCMQYMRGQVTRDSVTMCRKMFGFGHDEDDSKAAREEAAYLKPLTMRGEIQPKVSRVKMLVDTSGHTLSLSSAINSCHSMMNLAYEIGKSS